MAKRSRVADGTVIPGPDALRADAGVTATGSEKQEDPRLRRLLAAAHRAAGRGYDAVSMRELAAETRMSLATIYDLVGSKDELIARAHAGGMELLARDVARQPPRGRTAEARVRTVLGRLVDALEQDEVRTRALMRAMYSAEPRVGASRAAISGPFATMLDVAIGDADVPDRDVVTEILGHVVNSLTLTWLNGRVDSAGVRAQLDRAVATLLSGH
jgi:AcrR family transcriptional regulator